MLSRRRLIAGLLGLGLSRAQGLRAEGGTGNWLNGVTYGNGRFVAVGQGGTILTSP
jgi:hypothetical protein